MTGVRVQTGALQPEALCPSAGPIPDSGRPKLLRIVLIAALGLLGGCAGSIPETRYYLLSEPQEQTAADAGSVSSKARATLRLVAVRVPDYLETRGLVVALEDNRIHPATYHQWAEPLTAGLERYLAAALESATTERAGPGPAALLKVTLNHLHGSEAGAVVLDAQWQLESPEDRSVLMRGRFERVLKQVEPGYPALVATHRRLLDALAATIVAQWGSTSAAAI